MSFRTHWVGLQHQVATLVPDGRVANADLPVATMGHAALLDLLTAIHRDVTGHSAAAGSREIGELEAHPVALLGRLLGNHPRHVYADSVPSDVLTGTQSSTTATGERWRQIGHTATLAQHLWGTAPAQQRPTGDAAWSLVADIARLANAAAILDDDLAISANQDDPHLSLTFRNAARSGLRTTAQQVERLAHQGPLAEFGDIEAARRRRPPLVVRTATDLPQAQQRLVDLLDQGRMLAPRDIGLIAVAQARAALQLSHIAESVDADLARNLRTTAGAMAQVSRHAERLTHANLPDPWPREQAAETQRFLTRPAALRQRDGSFDMAITREYAATIHAVARTLHAAAQRQIAQNHWLFAAPHKPAWIPRAQTTHEVEQPILQAMQTAVEASEPLQSTAPRTSASEAALAHLPTVRTALTSAVAAREPTLSRPGHPGTRLAPRQAKPNTRPRP